MITCHKKVKLTRSANKLLSGIAASLFMLFILHSCTEKKAQAHLVLLAPQNGEVQLEVDSICNRPEILSFPIVMTLTNYSHKKVALIFESGVDSSNFLQNQIKNLYLVNANKDTFALGTFGDDRYIVFDERSATPFICMAYLFKERKGSFRSFEDFDTTLPKGKIVYHFEGNIPGGIVQERLVAKADTFLIPHMLLANTGTAKVLPEFGEVKPGWRNKRRLDSNYTH